MSEGEIEALIDEQCWSNDTVVELLWQFLRQKELMPELHEWLQVIAKAENEVST